MYRSFFDKIAFSYLIIILVVFTIIIVYASNVIRDNLVNDKGNTLAGDARMIAQQYITPYENGDITLEDLQRDLNALDKTLETTIWYVDKDGDLICSSHNNNAYVQAPKNIYDIATKSEVYEEFTKVGKFHGTFKETMLTHGTPIKGEYTSVDGMLILHTDFSQVSKTLVSMIVNFTIPLSLILIFCMFFLHYLTRRILQPLNQLNLAAREYAAGNFEARTGIHSNDEVGELASNLEHMADELSNLDEYRKSFVSNISHDFRSPLTSIKGYIEAMLDGTIPKDNQEKYLNIVLTETKRLSKLTTSMIEMSYNDSAGIKLEYSDFNLHEIIDPTVELFEGICKKKYIVIHPMYHTNDCVVRADATRIQQVLYNLIDNAVKFSPHGATITVTVKQDPEYAGKLMISVKDTGKGIEKEQQSHVFDRFFKGDASRGKEKQSSGLGLSIIKEIVRAHGEDITLTSTPGQGTEFVFTLKKAASDNTAS